MSFLSMSPTYKSVSFFGDDISPLVPVILHIAGHRRAELARVRVTGPAVYVALYANQSRAYVGVSADYPTRAGEGRHLDTYGAVQNLFIITEAQDRWTLDEARASERIVWETLREVCGLETVGEIPRGSPVAHRYAQLRGFCGRALQLIAGSGHVAFDAPDHALLAGALGNGDIVEKDSVGLPDGTLHAFVGKNIEAHAIETEEGDWIVLPGSEVWATPVASAGQLVRVRLESLMFAGCLEPHYRDPQLLVARMPLRFPSPSGAAQFVAGSKGYGPAGWHKVCRVREGTPGPLPRRP